jgi:uncharacterized protein
MHMISTERLSILRRPELRALLLSAVLAGSFSGCYDEAASTSAEGRDLAGEAATQGAIWPGRSIGDVRLGMSYAEVQRALGPAVAFGADHVIFANYPARGLELVFSSPLPSALSDAATVLSIGANEAADVSGAVHPGQRRDEIERLAGPGENTGDTVFYPAGFAVRYDAAGSPAAIAKVITVFPRYRVETRPPAMRGPFPLPYRSQPLDLTGKSLGVVDMHLHPGFFGRIPASTKPFLTAAVPPFLKPHLPAVSSQGLDPWAANLGILAQTQQAGVDHAVLFAVYTQKTTGYLTNEEVAAMVTDSRNRGADGLPWAFALASINFFDGYVRADGTLDPQVSAQRLRALASYFEVRRDVFIGIKLAHAHQGVAFDDARFQGVYDIASRYRVPVYLHTGFTPFPDGQNTPPFYDPLGLELTIQQRPEVTFVLGHVGQGDPAAVEHCLQLAQRYRNVYLEISALNRPLVVDDDGHPVPPGPGAPPQFPYVVAQIKARGLVDKTLYGSDGPQSAGTVRRYTALIRQAMVTEGYSDAQIAQVMGGTFQRVYFPAR